MWETSLSKPPLRSCRNCLLRPARFNQRAWSKIATLDVHEASGSPKCPATKKPQRQLVNSMARKLMAALRKSTTPNHAKRVAVAADVSYPAGAVALDVIV